MAGPTLGMTLQDDRVLPAWFDRSERRWPRPTERRRPVKRARIDNNKPNKISQIKIPA
jgi:hypothetical protein